MLRLVDYEQVPWSTIQGEGLFTGVPSAFVRLHGCDFTCSWCDTKKSWEEGSAYFEKSVDDVALAMRSYRLPHAVITGGNPALQEEDVSELIVTLREDWVDFDQGDTWRRGMYVTVETQASLFSEHIARHANFMSLSPKLHDWRSEPLEDYIKFAVSRPEKAAQVKIVVHDAESTWEALEHMVHLHHVAYKIAGAHDLRRVLGFVLQPEWSTSRSSVKIVGETLQAWYRKSSAKHELPLVRLLTQAHKGSLLVR